MCEQVLILSYVWLRLQVIPGLHAGVRQLLLQRRDARSQKRLAIQAVTATQVAPRKDEQPSIGEDLPRKDEEQPSMGEQDTTKGEEQPSMGEQEASVAPREEPTHAPLHTLPMRAVACTSTPSAAPASPRWFSRRNHSQKHGPIAIERSEPWAYGHNRLPPISTPADEGAVGEYPPVGGATAAALSGPSPSPTSRSSLKSPASRVLRPGKPTRVGIAEE